MDHIDIIHLKSWFAGYCRSFYSADETDQRNIALKEEHTRCVCENALRIAEDLGLNDRDAALAEVAALLHDVGRFPQYRQYKTFRDGVSVNHAALGAKVLLEQQVLRDLTKAEMIIRVVTLHNVFAVPQGLDDETLFFLRLVRDADKLDIWRVFLEYQEQHVSERASAVALDLPDTPACSPEVLACLQNRHMVNMTQLRTQNDFRLLQLAWVYDLNFPSSFAMVVERGYVARIAAALPETGEIAAVLSNMHEYLDQATDRMSPPRR